MTSYSLVLYTKSTSSLRLCHKRSTYCTFAAIVANPLEVVSFVLDAVIRAAVPDKNYQRPEISEQSAAPEEVPVSAMPNSLDSWAADTIDFAAMGFSSGFSKFALTEKPKKNSVTFTCDVCNVTLNSEATMKTHIGGAKHKKKVSKFEGKGAPDRGSKASGHEASQEGKANTVDAAVPLDFTSVSGKASSTAVEGNEAATTAESAMPVPFAPISAPPQQVSTPAPMPSHPILSMPPEPTPKKENENVEKGGQLSGAPIQTEDVSDDEIVCIDDEKEKGKQSSLTLMGLPTGFGGNLVEAAPKKDSVKYVCDICHVELNSEATMKIHIAGSKHIKAVAKIEGIQVPHETMKKVLEKSREINDKVREIAEQKKAEREALKNANKVRKDEEMRVALEQCREKAAAAAAAAASAADGSSEMPLTEGEVIEKIYGTKGFYCRVCDVEMNSEQTMRTHEGGNKHSLAMGTNRKFARPSKFAKKVRNKFEQTEEFRPREYSKAPPPSDYRQEKYSKPPPPLPDYRQERKTTTYKENYAHERRGEERPSKKQRRWDKAPPKSPEPTESTADNLSDGEIMSDDDERSVTSASVRKFDGKRYIDVEDEFRPREKRRRKSRSASMEDWKRNKHNRIREPHSPPRRDRRERKKREKRSPTRSLSPSPPPSRAPRHDRMAEEFLNSVILPESSSRRKRQTSSISSSRSSGPPPPPPPPPEVPEKRRRILSPKRTDCYTEKRLHPSQHLRLFERVRKLNEPVVGLQYVSEWLPCANRYLDPHYECDICRVGGKVEVMKAHLVGKAHREKFYEIATGAPRNLGNMSRDRLWHTLGEFDDVDRAKEKIETVYSDEQYPWPPNRAPWCAEAGGTGIVPNSARKNVRYRRKNYLSNDFQIARERRLFVEVADHKEENDNNLCNVDPAKIGEIADQDELASYTRVLNGILDKIQSFHAEEVGCGGGEAAALDYLLCSVSRIVKDINDVPVVTPPSRDEMIAAALMKAPAHRLKREMASTSAAAAAAEPPIPSFTTSMAMVPPAAVAAFAASQMGQLPIVDPQLTAAMIPTASAIAAANAESAMSVPFAPISAPPPQVPTPVQMLSHPMFPTAVPPVNLEQSAPRRTVINLELYKKKKKATEGRPAAATDTISCDLTVPPPTSSLPMDLTSELEILAKRDPRLRRK